MGCDDVTDGNEVSSTLVSPFSPPILAGTGDITEDETYTDCDACMHMKDVGLYDGECPCNIYTGCALSLDISNTETEIIKYPADPFKAGGCFVDLTFDYDVVLKRTVTKKSHVKIEIYVDGEPMADQFVYVEVPALMNRGVGSMRVDLTEDVVPDSEVTLKFKVK